MKDCKPLRRFVLLVAISLFLHQAVAFSNDGSQSQDQSSNTTADYEQLQQQQSIATTQAADTNNLEIDSREAKQDATTPVQQQQQSTVFRQSPDSQFVAQQQQEQQFSGGNEYLRKKISRPSLARLRASGNYQLANYSQPFDAQPASVFYRNHLAIVGGEHPMQQQQPAVATGRALNSAAPSAAVVVDSPASYAYISAPSQRVQQSAATTTSAMAVENGVGPSSLVLDEPPSYGQENLLDYTLPLQHAHSVVAPSRVQYYPNPAAAQAIAGSRHSAAAASNGGEHSFAHFMASPSMNSINYDDYYPTAASSEFGGHGDTFNFARSPFGYYNNGSSSYDSYGYPHYPSSSSSSSSLPLDSYHNSPGRSRWSWPWIDVSSYSGGPSSRDNHQHLYQSPMTAATFKKHYHHHHHLPAKHKEHDHYHQNEHEEHELMSKWEHGISIGEIACIAVAVVLGIIILGSPFFLLFMMLFNGGNLFGTTQMGLLAPATVQGGTGGVAGRRRKKRSLDILGTIGGGGSGLTPQDIEAKYKEHGVYGVTEYLFQKLSPLLDSGKLLSSFERIMEVKDDIENIVTKLAKHEQSKGFAASWTEGLNQAKHQHQHIEMRRKRRR